MRNILVFALTVFSFPVLAAVCKESDMCSPDLIKILNEKVKIQGNESLCKEFLSEKLAYFTFDKSHNFAKRNIGDGDTTIHISEGSLYIDINNDGQKERLIGMNMYSGRGNGCDQEYTLQVDEALSEVLKTNLNELLQPNSCRFYTRPFQYKSKVYIENRAARLDAENLQIAPNFVKPLFLNLLSDVYIVEKEKITTVCSFKYVR